MPDRKQARTEYDVTPEEFIQAWQSSNSAEEAAAKLKMPKAILHARASNYRGMGIELKKMPRPNHSLDIDNLNRLAEEAYKEHAKKSPPPAESASKKNGSPSTSAQKR